MITLDKVSWGRYLQYEGPWYRGQYRLPEVPATASLEQKILAVITSTEGGCFDAINMYDRMICTVGLIQWGDAGQFSVCDLLGEVALRDSSALTALNAHVAKRGYTFKATSKGWLFCKGDVLVDSIPLQQGLYLAGCDGKVGSWNAEQSLWAKEFVVALQAVWDSPVARQVQTEFTVRRLHRFATQRATDILFRDPAAAQADRNIVEAAQSSYLSFAANLPAVADKQLAALSTTAKKWSPEWLAALLKQLTFGPKIAIYPHRYDAIRPTVERLWGVNLPDTSTELASWQESMGISPSSGTTARLDSPKAVQLALISLGYDIGPHGADGVVGAKTKAALGRFQKIKGLTITESIDQPTREALLRAIS